MKRFLLSVLWLTSVILAFVGGVKISEHVDRPLPDQFDKFRRLFLESNNTSFSWLGDPRYRVFGRFAVMRPASNSVPGLYVMVMDKQPFPSVMITPDDDNKAPRGIDLRDKDGNIVSVIDKNQDGVFDFLFLQSADTLRMDEGLTGTWGKTINTKTE